MLKLLLEVTRGEFFNCKAHAATASVIDRQELGCMSPSELLYCILIESPERQHLEYSVKTHVNFFRQKLGVSSRTEAALAAVRSGLIADH